MKDKLITDLILAIQNFLNVGNMAFNKISISGEKNSENNSLEDKKNFWKKVLEKTDEKCKNLQTEAKKDCIDFSLVNIKLSYFRSLSRWISESPPSWSEYYKDINDALGEIYKIRQNIDRQYHLGKHLK